MTNRQAIITYSYHFFSEVLIIFLLFIPLIHVNGDYVPFIPYILVSLGVTVLFTFYTRMSTRYSPYILSAPIIFGLLYYIQLPLYGVIFLTLFFVWRYIKIRSTENNARENIYLRWALILTIIAALIINDIHLVLYIFILFLVLIIGYMRRHFTAVQRREQKNSFQFFPFYVALGLVGISIVIYYLLPMLRLLLGSLWFAFINIFIFIGSKVIQLLKWLQFFALEGKGEQQVQEGLGDVDQSQLAEPEQINPAIFDWLLRSIITLLIIVIVSFILWKAYQMMLRRFTQGIPSSSAMQVTYDTLEKDQQPNVFSRLFNRLRKKRRHPIRQLVYDTERKVSQTTLQRFAYETVEDWLQRLNLPGHLAAYQRVRYGEQDVTIDDIEQLKSELAEVEQLLKEQTDQVDE